jgi:hypothetical protein
MKTQQRKFVVERKSGRRRLTMQPKSIWGDTDLKALVREVETDAPHLFEPSAVSDTSFQISESQTEPRPDVQQSHDTETGDQPPTEILPVAAEQNTLQGGDLASGATVQLRPNGPRPRPQRKAKRRRVASDNRQAESANIALTVRPTIDKGGATDDELVALEQENRRLKGLLAQHFRQQNVQLRAMLARFAVR